MNDSRRYSLLMPKVVGAECLYPSHKRVLQGKFSHTLSTWNESFMMIDPIVSVIKKLLGKCGITALQLDVIAATCLVSNKLAYEAEIAGPRIGHPIQKEMNAKNAWVFDLTDSSLSTCLDVVQSYLLNNAKKWALIVRAENHAELLCDPDSGFLWPDGVGAMLLECSPTDTTSSHVYLTDYSNRFSPCVVMQNKNIRHINDFKGYIKFDYQEDMVSMLSRQFTSAASQSVVYDGWLPFDEVVGYSPEGLFLGPIYPFYYLSNFKGAQKTCQLFSFNPFRLDLAVREIAVR